MLTGRRDHEEEFRAFVTARSPALLRNAHLLAGGDRAPAEDLLQTALTRTYLAWHRIAEPAAVDSYVRTTLARTAASWSGRPGARGEKSGY